MTLKEARSKGRPALSPAQVQAMQRRIVDTAQRLFQSEGYRAISMRRLAKEVGCTPMTLYKYFDGKIAILRHLWAEIFHRLFDDLDSLAAAEPDARKRLHKVSLAYVDYWLDHPEHYRMVFMAEQVSQPDVSVFVEDQQVLARFDLIFVSLASALQFQADDPQLKVKSELLLCSLQGIAHNKITISAYPWSDPSVLVKETLAGLLRA